MTTSKTANAHRPIGRLATEIFHEHLVLGVQISGYVAAYLAPLVGVNSLHEKVGYDSAVGLAAYCLDALSLDCEWAGPTAERLTRELRDRVAEIYGDDFDELSEDHSDLEG